MPSVTVRVTSLEEAQEASSRRPRVFPESQEATPRRFGTSRTLLDPLPMHRLTTL
jgi:hypothetical protein